MILKNIRTGSCEKLFKSEGSISPERMPVLIMAYIELGNANTETKTNYPQNYKEMKTAKT